MNEHTAGGVGDPTKDSKRGELYLFWTLYGNRQPAVLTCFIAGDAANQLEKEHREDIIFNKLLQILRKIFGQNKVPMVGSPFLLLSCLPSLLTPIIHVNMTMNFFLLYMYSLGKA